MPRLLDVMTDAARQAAESLRRDFGALAGLRVTEKKPSDFVSSADLRSEAILREALSGAYPDYDMMLEESAPHAERRDRPRFIVDPLDGTTNFLHGMPHFAVAIALEVDAVVTAGVVYDVAKDEMFSAEAGQGARLNDAPMSVSAPGPLDRAVIATGIPHHGGRHHEVYLAALERVMHQVAGIRRWGSAALDLCWTAAGRYDAFFELGLAPWDVAAGMLLVREAGGSVSRADGSDTALDARDVLATNGDPLHAEMVRLLEPIHGVGSA